MSGRYRRSFNALGRLLAVVALTFGLGAQAPDSKGVTAPSPVVENQSAKSADPIQQPTVNSPLPVQIIESPSDAAHAQEREAKADKHDAEDLDAQVRAAEAAEEQITPMWVAAVLTFFGTALLVWNLTEARKANRIAHAAVEQSERHAQMELRAYILVDGGSIGIGTDTGGTVIFVHIAGKNYGKTPAKRVTTYLTWTTSESPFGHPPTPTPEPPSQRGAEGILAPESPIKTVSDRRPITQAEIEAIKGGLKRVYAWYFIDYEDAFGNPHSEVYRFHNGTWNSMGYWPLQPYREGTNPQTGY